MSGGRQLDGGPFAEQRLDDRVLVVTGAAPLMRRGRGGSIVNIITMASHGGETALTAYAASKGALATDGEHAMQTGTGEHVAPAPAGASA
jgi:NAD(P)-dependent dehydrogenase (short-subunit alcohol dehydrogenase family)